MAPSRIYHKYEEPEQAIIDDQSKQETAGFLSQYCKCASERTAVLIFHILTALSLFLWIITLSVLASKYSKMSRELEQLQSNQTVLRANGTNMKKQLEALNLKNSAYESKLNESLNMLENHKNTIKEVDKQLGLLQDKSQELLKNTFKLTDALHKVNASACRVCPVGWLLNRGQCYYFQAERKHWSFAKASCADKDSHLVIINDAEEQQFLDSQKSPKSYWIGLHDTASENNFVWVDGTPATYIHWGPSEPNNYGTGEDCVEMSHTGYWNDRECGGETEGYICERPWQC